MSTTVQAAPPVRAASRAVYIAFILAGVSAASWASRIPQVRDALGLSPSRLGLVLLALAVGSIISLLLAGHMVARLGSRRTITAMGALLGVSLAAAGVGYRFGILPVVLALLALGFANGAWDVAMNVQGALVERRLGRAIMPRYHAGFSVGTVAGALAGAAAVALHVSVTWHLIACAVVAGVVVIVAVRAFLPDDDEEPVPGDRAAALTADPGAPHAVAPHVVAPHAVAPHAVAPHGVAPDAAAAGGGAPGDGALHNVAAGGGASGSGALHNVAAGGGAPGDGALHGVAPSGGAPGGGAPLGEVPDSGLRGTLATWREPRTVLIGLFVLAFAFTEGAGIDWISVSMIDGYGTSAAVGTLAFAVFLSAMTAGRWFGPGLLDRYGRVPVVRVLAVISVVGLAVYIFGSSVPVAFAGALLWGLGASLGFPVGMSAAADEPSRAAPRVSVVASIGYCAFLGGPPLIGFLGDHVTVLKGLVAVMVLLGVALALAGSVRPLNEAT